MVCSMEDAAGCKNPQELSLENYSVKFDIKSKYFHGTKKLKNPSENFLEPAALD